MYSSITCTCKCPLLGGSTVLQVRVVYMSYMCSQVSKSQSSVMMHQFLYLSLTLK